MLRLFAKDEKQLIAFFHHHCKYMKIVFNWMQKNKLLCREAIAFQNTSLYRLFNNWNKEFCILKFS